MPSFQIIKDRDVAKNSLTEKSIKYPLWFGGSSSAMAALFSHPLDLVKVRLQMQPQHQGALDMLETFRHVYKGEGMTGLYRGISASILRQLTYSTARFATYEKLKQMAEDDGKTHSLGKLVWMASISGLVGGVVGNPADILNVRMQNDAALPPGERRNYGTAIHGLVRLVREEGWSQTIFRGMAPNLGRGVLMTAGQLAGYDFFKTEILARTDLKDNTPTHIAASSLAGLVATTLCSPFDVLKTRIMHREERQGMMSLIQSLTKTEGLAWMFRGWLPSFIRLGPHTCFTFVFLEQHKKFYRRTYVEDADR